MSDVPPGVPPQGSDAGSGTPAGAAPPPPVAPGPITYAAPGVPDPADVEKNKVYAVIGYLGLLFLVPMLAAKESRFAQYHANQAIVLFIVTVVGSMVLG